MTKDQAAERQRTTAWLEWMLTTSVPLYWLDANETIMARASGCLVDYGGRRFVLATPHAVARDTSGWVMDLDGRPGGGTDVWHLKHFAYAGEATRGSEFSMRETDLCFSEIPADVVSIYRFENLRGKFDERPRHVFSVDDWTDPHQREVYAFAGQVGGEFHEGVNAFVSDMEVFPALTFLRQEDEKYVFKLPVDHPGHAKFKGCSGAPIVGCDRRPVALLTDGDIESGTVCGISLTRYKSLLDSWCGFARTP